MTGQISFDPTPPVQGKELTISWTGPTPCTINLQWTPPGEPDCVFLVKGQTGAIVTVPATAQSIIATCLGEEEGSMIEPN